MEVRPSEVLQRDHFDPLRGRGFGLSRQPDLALSGRENLRHARLLTLLL